MLQLLKHPLVLLLCGIGVIVFYFSLNATADKRAQSAAVLQQSEKELVLMQKQVEDLEKIAISSQTDAAQDKIIRDELLLQQNGEFVVMIVDLPKQEEIVEIEKPALTPWQEWRELLF
jgi:flagellar basal body-associated protein FliL